MLVFVGLRYLHTLPSLLHRASFRPSRPMMHDGGRMPFPPPPKAHSDVLPKTGGYGTKPVRLGRSSRRLFLRREQRS